MNPFTYIEPETLPEALELLAQHGDDAKVIAGGTSLVNFMKNQLVQPRFVLGLRRLKALTSIKNHDGLSIGALATLYSLETSPIVAEHASLLSEACRHVATVRIRMIATIGGAVAHADPALDTPPALIALDSNIKVVSQRGERQFPAHRFFTGIFQSVLEADELVAEIIVPAQPQGSGAAFLKFLPATHDDYPTVSVAARLTIEDGWITDARIALGAVGETPVRAVEAEAVLRGMTANDNSYREAAAVAAAPLQPLADFRGSPEYKRDMAEVFVRRALAAAAARATGPVG